MSIAIVSETHFLGGNNAVSARVWNYAQSLRAGGERVLLLSYRDFSQGNELVVIAPGISAYQVSGKKNCSVGMFMRQLTKLVAGESVSAVLFYPTPNPSFELRFLWWMQQSGFKNVFCEINEVRKYEQSFVKTFSFPKRLAYKIITANSDKLTRFYRGLICISENIRQYFDLYNKNAIVVPILSDVPHSLPEHHTKMTDLVSFVFTGTVAIEKENLIELFLGFYMFNKGFMNWELLIYGNVPVQNKTRIVRILDILGLSAKVHLMGELEHAQISRVQANADCLILPRRNTKQNFYGFSTKLSEYAVSGTPIILTDTGVVFDYFKDGYDCLKVEGYEAQGFCDQLNRFVAMTSDEKLTLARNAFNTAKKFFDWQVYSDNLVNFLKQ